MAQPRRPAAVPPHPHRLLAGLEPQPAAAGRAPRAAPADDADCADAARGARGRRARAGDRPQVACRPAVDLRPCGPQGRADDQPGERCAQASSQAGDGHRPLQHRGGRGPDRRAARSLDPSEPVDARRARRLLGRPAAGRACALIRTDRHEAHRLCREERRRAHRPGQQDRRGSRALGHAARAAAPRPPRLSTRRGHPAGRRARPAAIRRTPLAPPRLQELAAPGSQDRTLTPCREHLRRGRDEYRQTASHAVLPASHLRQPPPRRAAPLTPGDRRGDGPHRRGPRAHVRARHLRVPRPRAHRPRRAHHASPPPRNAPKTPQGPPPTAGAPEADGGTRTPDPIITSQPIAPHARLPVRTPAHESPGPGRKPIGCIQARVRPGCQAEGPRKDPTRWARHAASSRCGTHRGQRRSLRRVPLPCPRCGHSSPTRAVARCRDRTSHGRELRSSRRLAGTCAAS